jgi:hypothetical protein
VNKCMHDAALAASGDETIRSQVMDLARKLDWPARFTARVLHRTLARTRGRAAHGSRRRSRQVSHGLAEDDPDNSNTFVGEVVGVIHKIEPAGAIIERMVREAHVTLQTRAGWRAGQDRDLHRQPQTRDMLERWVIRRCTQLGQFRDTLALIGRLDQTTIVLEPTPAALVS